MPSSSSSLLSLALLLRDRLPACSCPSNDVNHVVAPVALWIVAGWMLVNVLTGTYSRAHLGAGTTEYTRVLSAAGMMAALLGITSYLTKFDLSRGFYVLLFVIGVPLLVTWRWTSRRGVHRAHKNGRLTTRVLIAGTASHVDDVAAVLRRESWLGYEIVGAVLPSSNPVAATPHGTTVVGTTSTTAVVGAARAGRPHRLHRGRLPLVG